MLRSVPIVIVFVLLMFAWDVNSKNILFLCGLPSPSHHIWNREIANGLSASGHNITVLSTDIDIVPPTNVHYLLMNNVYTTFAEDYVKTMLERKPSTYPIEEAIEYHYLVYDICKAVTDTYGFDQLLAYPDDSQFDLIMYDFTVGACLLPFLHKFNYPPLIAVSAYGMPSYTGEIIGGHQYSAYVPHNNLYNIDPQMNIFNRALNMLIYTLENIFREKAYNKLQQTIYKEKFGQPLLSPMELEQRTILVFVNIHTVLDVAQPLAPNVIPVGGLHIKDVKPLPIDIESFVNASRKGTVLVSFGTNTRSDLLPSEKRTSIIQAMRELPDYHFVWKYESDMPAADIPKNVLIRSWLPQSDLLGHAHLKAFFTHSGLLSTQEAIWRGVPLLCMPFAFDQHQNAFKAKSLGIAEIIDFGHMSTNSIKSKLLTLLEKPKYAIKSKQLSANFRDQKETPLERALWHMEWTMRNPQPDYLKSPVLKLGRIAANNYDIIALISVAVVLIIALAWKVLVSIISILTRKSAISNHDKKKIH